MKFEFGIEDEGIHVKIPLINDVTSTLPKQDVLHHVKQSVKSVCDFENEMYRHKIEMMKS